MQARAARALRQLPGSDLPELLVEVQERKIRHRVPMALASGNFAGYTSDMIARCKVRWFGAAIVSPCWANILIDYVEGDRGHLMSDEIRNQKSRTVVRGG